MEFAITEHVFAMPDLAGNHVNQHVLKIVLEEENVWEIICVNVISRSMAMNVNLCVL